MARYYFDVMNEKQIARDDEGSEFNSLDTTVQGATRSAAQIGTDRLAKSDTSHVVIEERDEKDQRVCTVTASMKIGQHDQLSQMYHP